jgi:predicted RNA-binding Zn-ribbon protein involved in translation (DUF1610 family)
MAKKATKAKKHKCPNCGKPPVARPRAACVLEALAGVLVDRIATVGGHEAEAVMEWLAGQDTDGWWNRIGPLVDEMEDEFKKSMPEMAVCDNCGTRTPVDELEEITDEWTRVQPGGEVPAGECPKCGSLAYVEDENAG